MSQDPASSDESDFASIASRIGCMSLEKARDLVERAHRESALPGRYAIDRGELSGGDVDIIQTLQSAGESIPGYEILDLIGRGGMGVVYRGRQLSLNREVALKTILLNQLASETVAARFENEAQILARVTHPHIVSAIDFGRHAGRLYLAMELVQGKDVDRLIRDRGSLPEYLVWQIIRQAAEGLAHAASAGVIHRDIKPANLLLVNPPGGFALPTGIPMVKIADFGLSILCEDQRESRDRLTSDSVHVGSPTYMAPEQLESGEVGHAADIFGLGATAWHMLAGQPPVQDKSLRELVVSRLTRPTQPLVACRPGISEATSSLVSEMLQIDPNDRIGNYDTLLHSIDDVLSQLESEYAQKLAEDKTNEARADVSLDPTVVMTAEFRDSDTQLPGTSSNDSRTLSELIGTHGSETIDSAINRQLAKVGQPTHARTRRWAGLMLAGVLGLVAIAWGLDSLTSPIPPARQETSTGRRIALFDGQTLAGWTISSGSWSPDVDAEGGRVLKGTNGYLRSDLDRFQIDSFPDYFVVESTLQLLTASSAGLELHTMTPGRQQFVLTVVCQPERILITRQDFENEPAKVDTVPLKDTGRPVYLRIERQMEHWFILVDGRLVSACPSTFLTALPEIRLKADEGTARFADLSLASLTLRAED